MVFPTSVINKNPRLLYIFRGWRITGSGVGLRHAGQILFDSRMMICWSLRTSRRYPVPVLLTAAELMICWALLTSRRYPVPVVLTAAVLMICWALLTSLRYPVPVLLTAAELMICWALLTSGRFPVPVLRTVAELFLNRGDWKNAARSSRRMKTQHNRAWKLGPWE